MQVLVNKCMCTSDSMQLLVYEYIQVDGAYLELFTAGIDLVKMSEPHISCIALLCYYKYIV